MNFRFLRAVEIFMVVEEFLIILCGNVFCFISEGSQFILNISQSLNEIRGILIYCALIFHITSELKYHNLNRYDLLVKHRHVINNFRVNSSRFHSESITKLYDRYNYKTTHAELILTPSQWVKNVRLYT